MSFAKSDSLRLLLVRVDGLFTDEDLVTDEDSITDEDLIAEGSSVTNEELVADGALATNEGLVIDEVLATNEGPSDELTYKVKEALKHHDPYHKLVDVFNNHGYFLPKKIILGHKIYGMTYLTIGKNFTEHNHEGNNPEWKPPDDFSESEFDDLLIQWENWMSSYNFDLSYLVSINGELIMKNKIKEWIKFCLESDLDSLQVIGCKELYPLYEIFDFSLRQEIESVLGISRPTEFTISNQPESVNRTNIKERVLMAGIVPIKDPPYSYSVKFPDRFKSNNYQVFGKFITQDDEPIDDVGYFSPYTRKINIFGSGNEPFALISNNSNIVLKIPENLPQDSVIIVSFKYPPSHYEPKFIAKIKSYQNNKILFNIHCRDYESSDDEENNEDSNSIDDEHVNENPKFFENEDANKDSKSFDDQVLNIEDISAYNENREKYSNKDLKAADIEFAYKNSISDKENVIGKASKYSIQWFILQNSDIYITDSSEIIYLNKIGREFHLTKPSMYIL
ncbi:11376_t:CDS:2 [Racocetra fulgida]|uniref:11376_t:CDS:1 n=1 Tax=Racocetra fulgida TaxID=60492 RepID=A0A9N8VLL4_9GLOM|nr:11376_t:CDS:2 [Racocetra fulgida]